MSHFTVLTCLSPERIAEHKGDARDALAALLAPYDENTQVEPYRSYEDGEPRDYWWVSALRRDRKGYDEMQEIGEGAMRARLLAQFTKDASSWDPETPAEKVDKEIADYKRSAEPPHDLGESPTWAQVIASYGARWQPVVEPEPDADGVIEAEVIAVDGKPMIGAGGPPLDANGDVDTETMFIDDDEGSENHGRAYTWSRYNPDSKWDWYAIGGRWQRSLLALPDADESDLVFGAPGTFGDNGEQVVDEETGGRWCDGMPRRLLNAGRMRDIAAARMLAKYDAWQAIVAEHGEARSWASFVEQAKAADTREAWDAARLDYRTQPAIIAALKTGLTDEFGGDCPAEEYACTREEIERRARDNAVPGYSMVCADGRWMAPGKMGWWGASSDDTESRAIYNRAASEYIDALPGDTLLVMTDCHI